MDDFASITGFWLLLGQEQRVRNQTELAHMSTCTKRMPTKHFANRKQIRFRVQRDIFHQNVFGMSCDVQVGDRGPRQTRRDGVGFGFTDGAIPSRTGRSVWMKRTSDFWSPNEQNNNDKYRAHTHTHTCVYTVYTYSSEHCRRFGTNKPGAARTSAGSELLHPLKV